MSGPWCVPAGEGNELVVCAGDDPTAPGEILFVVRAPNGTSRPYPHSYLADLTANAVQAVNSYDSNRATIEALVGALEEARYEITHFNQELDTEAQAPTLAAIDSALRLARGGA